MLRLKAPKISIPMLLELLIGDIVTFPKESPKFFLLQLGGKKGHTQWYVLILTLFFIFIVTRRMMIAEGPLYRKGQVAEIR